MTAEQATEETHLDRLEKEFLATPNVETLLELYRALDAELKDHLLAAILDKVRPIQHRVTLIQADATPELLEVLARDPHHEVRSVVASHPNISQEVCLRLGEDMNDEVRLALRKNPNCHPLIQAALFVQEKGPLGDPAVAELLIEMSWMARALEYAPEDLVELVEEWTGLRPLQIPDMTVEQARLLYDVLLAKLGKGKMPRKPRKQSKKKGRK
ncbi:MAG: hypothetical protein D6731_16825 [Planctomycetota bacterium]|nr:MAG: hypothetical protein D6731_16825 [Planctomycetota bacterium]